MPAVLEAIDKMTTSEKFDTMSYLWSSLSIVQSDMAPAWHKKELEKTEARVASGIERSIPWGGLLRKSLRMHFHHENIYSAFRNR